MIPTAISAAVSILAVLGLVFYLVRWTRSVSERADERIVKLRDQDSSVRGLRTSVSERDVTIATLRRQTARANASVEAAKDDFNEILETLASGGNASGIARRINTSLDRLSKLSETSSAPSTEDHPDP